MNFSDPNLKKFLFHLLPFWKLFFSTKSKQQQLLVLIYFSRVIFLSPRLWNLRKVNPYYLMDFGTTSFDLPWPCHFTQSTPRRWESTAAVVLILCRRKEFSEWLKVEQKFFVIRIRKIKKESPTNKLEKNQKVFQISEEVNK